MSEKKQNNDGSVNERSNLYIFCYANEKSVKLLTRGTQGDENQHEEIHQTPRLDAADHWTVYDGAASGMRQ
ncbi:hypothetical protein Back11_60120 [Paenibacillus baekrokdamisoli]|uniref:Uncharacterized protein n=1 Tax=Paenibacillus baekrokdamisoli TaxID=1712516 RepID=A0A3G9J0F6_9BACL|nr:hypothetical protein Back11_60120 [Paenibacillus baekrokdamisoli]